MALIRGKTHIDVKAPSPKDVLNKETANQRAQNTPKGPCREHDGEVLWPLPQGHDIGEDNLPHGDDAASADTLHGAPNEEHSEVFSDGRAERRAHGEKKYRDHEHLFAAEDVGQGGDEGLADGAGEEVRGARPECVR